MASNSMIKGIRLMVRTDMTQREIAEKLNVTENTVSNWKKDKDYKRIREEEERAYLGSLPSKAIKTLDFLVSDASSENVRLQAAQDILNRVGFRNQLSDHKILAEIESIEIKNKLMKEVTKDTSLLDVLTKAVNNDE